MNIELKPHYDVVISGAGPCGSTMANMLGDYGISTLLIDVEADILDIPRAVGMCDEGSRILKTIGLDSKSDVDFLDVAKTNFTDKNMTSVFSIDMDSTINGMRQQRTFYQPQLERGIRALHQRYECLDFSPSTELIDFTDSGDNVDLTICRDGKSEMLSCRFLVGCDGAKSPIRKKLNIGFGGRTYEQRWLIIDIKNNPIDSDEIDFSIDPRRPGITLPLPCGRRRWEFVVKDDDDVDELMSDCSLRQLLSPWGDFKTMGLERKAIYAFHARSATHYSHGNVFLAGDAAHITPPFAGQGMMAGLRDAQNLSWKLAGVIQGAIKPEVLLTYQEERIPHSKQIIRLAQWVGRLVLPQTKAKIVFRDIVIKALTFTGLYSADRGLAFEKVTNHINGPMIKNLVVSHFLKKGFWFPQHNLSHNGEVRPFDYWAKNRFVIVTWDCDAKSLLPETLRDRWSALGGTFLRISLRENQTEFSDISGQYRQFFRRRETVLLRPDKMIAFHCKKEKLNRQLSRYIDSIATKNTERWTGELHEQSH